MDIEKARKLAGVQIPQQYQDLLSELASVSDDITPKELEMKINACLRAMLIADGLPSGHDRAKWLKAAYDNLTLLCSQIDTVLNRRPADDGPDYFMIGDQRL